MASMNAMGHVIVAGVAAADGCIDTLWDLLEDLAERRGTEGVTVHSMTRDSGQPRYCVHPTSERSIEFRHDDLREALLLGATWVAAQMDPGEMWRGE